MKNVIFCWNEPANYGGHSILLNLQENCLECLHTTEDSIIGANQLSLVVPSENISKNLTGCAGLFTPFSYLDSSQTAILASKQCLNALRNDIVSMSITWKGEGDKNLECTQRYHDMNLMEESALIKNKNCRVCNG